MKLSKFANLLVVTLTLTVAVSACKKRPGMVTPLPGSMTKNVQQPPPGEPFGQTGVNEQDLNRSPLEQAAPGTYDNYIKNPEIFREDTVYFAFDSSAVRPAEQPKVAKVADYLKAHPSNALEVDGYCDERGTEEYNRALGERRALAVREELARLGVDPSHVVTVTFGKDMPADPGHNEAAWAKNRRAEFILLTPP